MSRRSNKSIAETLTPSIASSAEDIAAKVHTSSSSSSNDNVDDILLEKNRTVATEGFTTHKFCELILKDRKTGYKGKMNQYHLHNLQMIMLELSIEYIFPQLKTAIQ
jgi:hypothetical protein